MCYMCMLLYLSTGVTNSVAVSISPLTEIMQEQTQRFSESGIKSGFIGEAQKDPVI